MLTIIHAADFHLDSPFSALSPEQAAQRRGEQRELLKRLIDLAHTSQAQLVLLAGDLLDGEHTYRETAQALSRALGQLGCPVVISPGNHDPYTPHSPYATLPWPENVHIFQSGNIEAWELPNLNCVVYGRAFTASLDDTSPLEGFSVPQDGRIHLMCLHGDLGKTSRYAPIAPSQVAASGLDYLALGHVHSCSGLQYSGAVPWAYPGCPEGRGFDELGEKGVLCGKIDKGTAQMDFIPLSKRRYEILTIDVSADFKAALPQNAQEDIYRILLTGESGIEGPDLAALHQVAAPYFYSVTLQDRTTVRRDLWARAGEDTLTGLFLREMQTRLAKVQGEKEQRELELAVRFGLAALENGEDGCL